MNDDPYEQYQWMLELEPQQKPHHVALNLKPVEVPQVQRFSLSLYPSPSSYKEIKFNQPICREIKKKERAKCSEIQKITETKVSFIPMRNDSNKTNHNTITYGSSQSSYTLLINEWMKTESFPISQISISKEHSTEPHQTNQNIQIDPDYPEQHLNEDSLQIITRPIDLYQTSVNCLDAVDQVAEQLSHAMVDIRFSTAQLANLSAIQPMWTPLSTKYVKEVSKQFSELAFILDQIIENQDNTLQNVRTVFNTEHTPVELPSMNDKSKYKLPEIDKDKYKDKMISKLKPLSDHHYIKLLLDSE